LVNYHLPITINPSAFQYGMVTARFSTPIIRKAADIRK